MADSSHEEREATSKVIEKVHKCPGVWDDSPVAYKDTKDKQKKSSSQRTPPFLLSLSLSSSVSLFYVSATAQSWPCCKLPCVMI